MTNAAPPRLICILLPRFNMMSLISLMEPVRIAHYLSGAPLFSVEYCAPEPGPVIASNGMQLEGAGLPEKISPSDLVVLVASWGAEHYDNPRLLSWLRRQERLGMQLCAVEMAPYIFARAGLLVGRRATTHWAYLPGFQEVFPDINAVEQLFTIDGRIMTCAGSTGALDFMQHVIRMRHGDAMVPEISDNLMHPLRDEASPQRQTMGRGLDGLPDVVQTAVALMNANLSEPMTVPEIAEHVAVSQRQLERQFQRAMGCSVVQFGLVLRLQHARVLLISTDLSVRDIAAASGFNSLSHFAYAFRKRFDCRPSEYRQAWPEAKDAPSWPGTLASYIDRLRQGREGA